jgi:CheY-like chemotaxis protein
MATSPPTKPRVLVVDDDHAVRRALARVLSRTHEVEEADGGRAALALVRCGHRFDAIVCDVTMPEMTALELFEVLAHSHPEQAARMIAMTGGVTRQDELDAIFGERQLTKPIHAADLLATISAVARLADVA